MAQIYSGSAWGRSTMRKIRRNHYMVLMMSDQQFNFILLPPPRRSHLSICAGNLSGFCINYAHLWENLQQSIDDMEEYQSQAAIFGLYPAGKRYSFSNTLCKLRIYSGPCFCVPLPWTFSSEITWGLRGQEKVARITIKLHWDVITYCLSKA